MTHGEREKFESFCSLRNWQKGIWKFCKEVAFSVTELFSSQHFNSFFLFLFFRRTEFWLTKLCFCCFAFAFNICPLYSQQDKPIHVATRNSVRRAYGTTSVFEYLLREVVRTETMFLHSMFETVILHVKCELLNDCLSQPLNSRKMSRFGERFSKPLLE